MCAVVCVVGSGAGRVTDWTTSGPAAVGLKERRGNETTGPGHKGETNIVNGPNGRYN